MKFRRPLRIQMLGLRGFPNVQGGIETHAEHLCPLLVKSGCHVKVLVRSPYQHNQYRQSWNGVEYATLWSPKSKGFEAIIHTFLGVLYAGFIDRPDILHIHGIGPALLTPFARLLGLRVVVTHHGPDYDRQKWGRVAKVILKLGERCGMTFANQCIVISEVIRRIVHDKYQRDSMLIHNGVPLPELPISTDALQKHGLESGKYILLVSRLVAEKRHFDLIDAFIRANLSGWKLGIVGSSDHPDEYSTHLLHTAKENPAIVCTGFQTGLDLQELYAHAGMFVLPSSHEGLPIAMLEALSYGLRVISSDIPANLEVGLPEENYYPLGDIDALANKLVSFSRTRWSDIERNRIRLWVSDHYNWNDIARETLETYHEIA